MHSMQDNLSCWNEDLVWQDRSKQTRGNALNDKFRLFKVVF